MAGLGTMMPGGHLDERGAQRDPDALGLGHQGPTDAALARPGIDDERQDPDDPVVVLEAWQLAHQDAEHVLDEIVGIGPGQGVAAQPAAQQWRVQVDETLPRLSVRVGAKTLQQAERRFRHARHPRPLTNHIPAKGSTVVGEK